MKPLDEITLAKQIVAGDERLALSWMIKGCGAHSLWLSSCAQDRRAVTIGSVFLMPSEQVNDARTCRMPSWPPRNNI